MMKDNNNIRLIYESLQSEEIILKDEPEFSWNGIFESTNHDELFLLESFEKIVDKESFDSGFFDVYEIELRSGQKFTVTLSYNDSKHIRDLAKRAIIEAEKKNQMDIVSGYESFLEMEDNQYVVMIEFKDSGGRHNDTGEVGIHAIELFEMLKQSFLHSIQDIGDNLIGIMMRVHKNNPKRMNFYKIILKRYLSEDFPNVFVDPNTNSLRNYDLLIAKK